MRRLAALVAVAVALTLAAEAAMAQGTVTRFLDRIGGWLGPEPSRRAAPPLAPPLPRAKPRGSLAAANPAFGPFLMNAARAEPSPLDRPDWIYVDPAVAFAPPGAAMTLSEPAPDVMAVFQTVETPTGRPQEPPGLNLAMVDPGRVPLPRRSPAVDRACHAALTALGVTFDRVGRVREGACGMAAAVRVTGIAAGGTTVELTQPAQLSCRTAEALARFVRTSIQPAAAAALQRRITGLRVAASYACRNRNSQPGARLSEHGLGNAIDISGFRTGDGDWIAVGDVENTTAESGFLRQVRVAACGPFKTVLGPGSDAHHGDHFHLDLAKRRNGSAYCR